MKFIRTIFLVTFILLANIIVYAQDAPPPTKSSKAPAAQKAASGGPVNDPQQPGGGTSVSLDSISVLILLVIGGITIGFLPNHKKKKIETKHSLK